MRNLNELQSTLHRLDGKGYKAYKDIKGTYDCGTFEVIIDHVQGDPFASPSKVRVRVPQMNAGFPADTYNSPSREVALRDLLTRAFDRAIRRHAKGDRGIGQSGAIRIDTPGQEVLERTAMFIDVKYVEARFVMGLPAFGRRIAGRHAAAMFVEELPHIVQDSLLFQSLDSAALYRHIETVEDADALRAQLSERGLVAFVPDGAILPRTSGIDPRPLPQERAVPFNSPDSLRVEFDLPNCGPIAGMGVPQGITLIVGGGYHGKSTLLNALELGVYNHVPQDGREFVVTDPTAVKIRAEDGRRIERVCISPFINNLPLGVDTDGFCSENASGSTSQAANIIEMLEAGARTLLIDEDTSATNFMIRDHRMQELVSKDREPITPFIDKARQLFTEQGVSTVLVIGGSGDYFDVADYVICMVEYRPRDVTEQARELARKYKAERRNEGGQTFGRLIPRIPQARSIDPSRGKKPVNIKCRDLTSIDFGRTTIDLSSLEQLVDVSQTRAVGDAIHYATRYMKPDWTLKEVLDAVMGEIDSRGLDTLGANPAGNFARFRRQELAAAINRLRTLTVQQLR